jgi:hypothetical protein
MLGSETPGRLLESRSRPLTADDVAEIEVRCLSLL